ncbi:MAG: Holliday junction branch migration protein RuvA [Puniceicoccales bacterium]|nr:Holliday junction branch migration protein RuvA [Puniceicoccales bacterium]
MIVFLDGCLAEIGTLSVVIDVGGVGYSVNIPLNVGGRLPAIGNRVKLQIHAIYREDRRDLYGFLTAAERDFFKLIVEKVSGIGPKIALNMMSRLALPALVGAISTGDIDALSRCHGVGKKSAERIIVELSDKSIASILSKSSPWSLGESAGSCAVGDAMAALISLGYKMVDAEKAVRRAISSVGDAASTEEIVRAALNS